MTRVAEVAARNRQRLTAIFPDVKWWVRAHPSHPASTVEIEWAGWPSFETVKALVQEFNKLEDGSIHIRLSATSIAPACDSRRAVSSSSRTLAVMTR
jgi:hypothetical protein